MHTHTHTQNIHVCKHGFIQHTFNIFQGIYRAHGGADGSGIDNEHQWRHGASPLGQGKARAVERIVASVEESAHVWKGLTRPGDLERAERKTDQVVK